MKYIPILFLLFNTVIQAQDFPYWNDISEGNLEMTIYENDTIAAAVVLVNYGKTRFKIYNDNSCFMYDYHYQIKILKKAAFSLADVSLSFSKKYPIQNLEGVTHNWENGKKVSTAVTDIFETKVSKYNRKKSITFRNVKVGSVIEYKFSIPRPRIVAPREFHFQNHYPVKFSEYHFAFPSNYDYKLISPKIEFYEKGDTGYVIHPNGYQPIGIAEYWWKTRNIPALKDEPYVNDVWSYRHHMKMQLTRYRILGTNIEEDFLSTWETLATNYRENKDAGKRYLKSKKIKYLLQFTDILLSKNSSDEEKMIQLFDFVQAHVEWTEEYNLYTNQSFKKTYERGYGNSSDINLMLLALLKHYEIEANPVMISTQDNGYLIHTYPFIGQFNHVIIAVEIEGKTLFLDAINPRYPYDVLPLNSYSSKGFWIGNDTEKWVHLVSRRSNEVAIINMEIMPDGQIKGKIAHQCKSYAAQYIRTKITTMGEEKYQQTYFKKPITNFTIDSIKFDNLLDNRKPFNEEITFTINDAVQINGDFMYFNPMLDFAEMENPFKAEKRHLPIELPYLFSEQYIIRIKIPKGYMIDEIPDKNALKLDTNQSGFTYMTNFEGDEIQIVSKINLANRYFDVNDYPIIQKFYAFIVEKQSENIVLRKIP
ncbi:MAG: transglutaminase-like putative cysteine protease [Saprospiraceae bacterium]|jgi:transglutaminase-like putative cysteine protease